MSKKGKQKGKEQGKEGERKKAFKGKASNSPTTIQKSVLALPFEMRLRSLVTINPTEFEW